jgi:hypothetical protein
MHLRTVDFGVLTFNPADRDLSSIVAFHDELVLLVPPRHPGRRWTMRWKKWGGRRSSHTTIRHRRVTKSCGCTSSAGDAEHPHLAAHLGAISAR